MKRKYGMIVAGAWVVLCLPLAAGTVEYGGVLSAKVASAYVWRGQILNEEPVIQPSIAVDLGQYVSMSVWGTWDLTDQEGTWTRNRVDTTVECIGVNGKHIFRTGVTAYIYHDNSFAENEDTYDVFLSYTWDVPALPTLRVNYDFGEVKGVYGTLTVAHSFPVADNRAGVNLRASIGAADQAYAEAFFAVAPDATYTNGFTPDASALIDATAMVEVPVYVGEQGAVVPGVAYTTLLDGKVRDAVEASGDKADETVFSLTLRYTF